MPPLSLISMCCCFRVFSLGDLPHLLERQLAGQFEAHHHHASDPEEQDVVTRLQQSARVEHFQVFSLRLVGTNTHTEIKLVEFTTWY